MTLRIDRCRSTPGPRRAALASFSTLVCLFVVLVFCTSAACSDEDLARLDETNVDAAALAATQLAAEAFYAARIAETIDMRSPRNPYGIGSAGDGWGLIVGFGQTATYYDDANCFETHSTADGSRWYALNECGFNGCWGDGLAWRDDDADWTGNGRGFIYEGLVVDCGGDREIELNDVAVACKKLHPLDCAVTSSIARPSATQIEFVSSGGFIPPGSSALPFRYALDGEAHIPTVGGVAFETDPGSLTFDGCPTMVPISGKLVVRGSHGSRAEVRFAGCSQYRVCLDRSDSAEQICSTHIW